MKNKHLREAKSHEELAGMLVDASKALLDLMDQSLPSVSMKDIVDMDGKYDNFTKDDMVKLVENGTVQIGYRKHGELKIIPLVVVGLEGDLQIASRRKVDAVLRNIERKGTDFVIAVETEKADELAENSYSNTIYNDAREKGFDNIAMKDNFVNDPDGLKPNLEVIQIEGVYEIEDLLNYMNQKKEEKGEGLWQDSGHIEPEVTISAKDDNPEVKVPDAKKSSRLEEILSKNQKTTLAEKEEIKKSESNKRDGGIV